VSQPAHPEAVPLGRVEEGDRRSNARWRLSHASIVPIVRAERFHYRVPRRPRPQCDRYGARLRLRAQPGIGRRLLARFTATSQRRPISVTALAAILVLHRGRESSQCFPASSRSSSLPAPRSSRSRSVARRSATRPRAIARPAAPTRRQPADHGRPRKTVRYQRTGVPGRERSSRGRQRTRPPPLRSPSTREGPSTVCSSWTLGARPAWFRRGGRRGITRGEGRPRKEVRRARQQG
jgi:hypothetical protein